MVKRTTPVKESLPATEHAAQWLHSLQSDLKAQDIALLSASMDYAKLLDTNTPTGESCLQLGLDMVNLLSNLNLDTPAVATALLLFTIKHADISPTELSTHINPTVAKLLQGVQGMDTIGLWYQNHHTFAKQSQYTDNLRKMLLALVDNVDVVLIKLAEQVLLLRMAKTLPSEQQQKLARLVKDIYAPLANRLGIGQLKWELEDLAFRYLEPDTYKQLAKAIEGRRSEREQYVLHMQQLLGEALAGAGVAVVEITGRVKHIYSIYRKMVRKNVPLEQIYDAIALRVLTQDIASCYAVLSIVHDTWEQIPAEFDDYISKPKPNGYQSIHTAIIGPAKQNVEIQIRTQKMHEESELGFAAHWKYKEGASVEHQFEAKINWLRQLLEWQQELSGEDTAQSATETTAADLKSLFQDRVYVFSPKGDIVDLPTGATPLDFAYQIHTQIGHRCKGAKVNEAIVPLTYVLKTGDRVNILTQKQPNPSRDWMNAHTGYLATARARAKVFHWFKQQDYERYLEEGKDMWEREIKAHRFPAFELAKLTKKLDFKQVDDFFAALGSGDLKIGHPIQVLQHMLTPASDMPTVVDKSQTTHTQKAKLSQVHLAGIDQLLSRPAQCCKPLPGDRVIGFITRGRGVSVHRRDCPNILANQEPERLIEVSWQQEPELASHFLADLTIWAEDRADLIRDLTSMLSGHKTKLIAISTQRSKNSNDVAIKLTLELQGLHELQLLQRLFQQVPGVIEVERKA